MWVCTSGDYGNSDHLLSPNTQAVEEFSYIMDTMMDDLSVLSQSPASNLPHSLQPVLQAILSGRMPSRWWSGPSITLDEGLNSEHMFQLASTLLK